MLLVIVSLGEGSREPEPKLRYSSLLYNLQNILRIYFFLGSHRLEQGSLHPEQPGHTVLLKALLKVVCFYFLTQICCRGSDSGFPGSAQVSFYNLTSEYPPLTEIKAMSVPLGTDGWCMDGWMGCIVVNLVIVANNISYLQCKEQSMLTNPARAIKTQ